MTALKGPKACDVVENTDVMASAARPMAQLSQFVEEPSLPGLAPSSTRDSEPTTSSPLESKSVRAESNPMGNSTAPQRQRQD